jgi:hypothetical protein
MENGWTLRWMLLQAAERPRRDGKWHMVDGKTAETLLFPISHFPFPIAGCPFSASC